MAQVIVIGGGIVGLAVATEWANQKPKDKILLLEKEQTLAFHQTGRNSGVIHSGIYYKPGSLKASTCRRGKKLLESYCDVNKIAWEQCGKVIVALDEAEEGRLEGLVERGKANGVACERISGSRLRSLEPHVKGQAALHVSETGICDYLGVCQAMAKNLRSGGHQVQTGARVTDLYDRSDCIVVTTTVGHFGADWVINCAGLHSDKVVEMADLRPEAKIVPFRGEYFELTPESHSLCQNLIYPTPDPSFPFLGVHLTRMIRGGVECGPNAVLAFAREGYTNLTVDLGDLVETLTYPGFLRLAAKHWRPGWEEMVRSFSKKAFVQALQRLVPDLREEHLVSAEAGVRAQALRRDGSLVDDFVIQRSGRMIHVVNAPSPAATASLAIAEIVVASALS
ncbi:MAG: L-2-hydroxyglutarate oxidase [Fimbriimonadaceae bacterium]|nr:L-2-hydroxyglutarate oxidase [Fimbriimonadaceae bacterium]